MKDMIGFGSDAARKSTSSGKIEHFETAARWLVTLGVILLGALIGRAEQTLLNVSYDPTREFYAQYNAHFSAQWAERTGEAVTIKQSHGGSGKQARSVIDGVEADVVTLALAYDIDAIARQGNGLIAKDWQNKLPEGSAPYTSVIVFLVRKGNPKGIHTWADLIRPGVEVITPNPKTSGGARWNHLAAYGAILSAELGGLEALRDSARKAEVVAAEAKAEAYLGELYRHVPVLDSGARGATTSFVQRRLGDVLLAWENEALLAVSEFGKEAFDIVVPEATILCEPTVAVVEGNAKRHGTLELAEAYLRGLYTPEAQRLAAEHGFRPRHPEGIAPETLARFRQTRFFRLSDLEKNWRTAHRKHFADGALFDRIYAR